MNIPWDTWVHALLHTLWQGPLIVLLTIAILALIPARHAETRYALCCAALILIITALGANLAMLQIQPEPSGAITQAGTITDPSAATHSVGERPSGTPVAENNPLPLPIPWPILLGWTWCAGFLLMTLRTARQLHAARQTIRESAPLSDPDILNRLTKLTQRFHLHRTVRAFITHHSDTPFTLGTIRPVILLPAAVLNMPVEHVEAALAHELAHIRRYDYLANLLQRAAECLLFFNPAVWWISRQIRIERESCCDRLAAAKVGDVGAYTRALTAWGHRAVASATLAPAMGPTRDMPLLDRVRRLLLPDDRPATAGAVSTTAGLLAACGLLIALVALSFWGTTLVLTDAERVQAVQEIISTHGAAVSREPWWNESGEALESATIIGVIRTADGQPLPEGVRLDAFSTRGTSSTGYGSCCDCIHRDADGHVTFQRGVTPGEIYVTASAKGLAPATAGPILGKPGETVDAGDLVLHTGTALTLDLHAEDGTPLADTDVKLRHNLAANPPTRTFTTGPDGSVLLDHLAHYPITLEVSPNGYQESQIEIDLPFPDQHTWTLQPTRTVTVKVVHAETGEPVPGAIFHELADIPVIRGQNIWTPDDHLNEKRTTDDQGVCRLDYLREDGVYTYLVQAPSGQRALLEEVRAGDPDRTLNLGEGIVVAGTFTGDLEPDPTRERYRPFLYVKTPAAAGGEFRDERALWLDIQDGVGHFRVDGLHPGKCTITYPGGKETFDLATSREDIAIHIPEAPDTTTTPAPTREVIVRFDHPKHAPPEGSLIAYHRDAPGADYLARHSIPLTDGVARFDIPVPNTLALEPKGLIGYFFHVDPFNRQRDIPLDDAPYEITLEAIPAGAIYGTVHEADGRPAENILINLVVDEKPSGLEHQNINVDVKNTARGSTDRVDTFVATPLPLGGTYAIVAYRDYNYVASPSLRLTLRNATPAIDLVIPEGQPLNGIVRTPEGTPVANAEVELSFNPRAGHSFGKSTNPRTDAEGRFRFDALNPDPLGTYALTITPEENYQAVYTPEVPLDQSPLEITLQPGHTITGKLLHKETGQPLPRAEVTANPEHDGKTIRPTVTAITDPDGAFRFTNLGPVRYRIMVNNMGTDTYDNLITPDTDPPITIHATPY